MVGLFRRKAEPHDRGQNKVAQAGTGGWWLPEARRREYIPDRLPTTDEVRTPAAERLAAELVSGQLQRVNDQAGEILKRHEDEPDILGCAKGLGGYIRLRAGLPASELDELVFQVWLGIGFNVLEGAAGARVEGLVHPTIWNTMAFSSSVDRDEGNDPRIARLYSMARDGGYSAYRHRLMAETVFARCEFS